MAAPKQHSMNRLYGLMTHRQVAVELGISAKRVQQIETRALKKLFLGVRRELADFDPYR